ncbi:MAG: hypothetical protein D6816_06040 [Bacteroidetes bacterium]|nr:MAG: hypothetical protein D6816_06040 [Bacteroidota bacterium]
MSGQLVPLYECIEPARKPVEVLMEKETFVKGEEPQKFYYLEGLVMEGEVVNKNGRIYPASEIKSAVDQLNEELNRRGGTPIPGELDHPDNLSLNFDRVAVGITKVWYSNNNGYAKMRVLPGGVNGDILIATIKAGIRVGVSSRGAGIVDDVTKRVSNYHIVTIDAVLEPSAPNAFPEATLAESIQKYKHGPEVIRLTEMARVDPAAKKHLERELHRLFTELRDDVLWRK